MNGRLKQVRKSLRLSQDDFGKRIGITGSQISKLESGVHLITDKIVLSVCREFNVNEEWFRLGTGEMSIETDDSLIIQLAQELNLDEYAIRALQAYIKLDPQNQKAIHQYIMFVASNPDEK